jgi:hypothetical protein
VGATPTVELPYKKQWEWLLHDSLKLLPDDKTIEQLQSDYEKMLSSGMIYKESPPFSDIVDSIN